MVHLFIPYYVSGVKLSNWLAKITGIDVNNKKELIVLPEAPLTDKTLEYKMCDPMRCLTGIVKERETDGINILVYCSLIDYQIVGSISSPLLRIVALNRNRKGINWRQYTKLQYTFMNTKGTIYARPRWAGMSPGIVTAMDGNGFPIYKEPKRPMKGSGIVSSLGRDAKRSARRAVRSKLGGLKRKIGAQLKGKIGAQITKKVTAAVKRRVKQPPSE